MLLLIDNYDSFTYNLCDYFLQLGVDVNVVRNDLLGLEGLDHLYTGIVISPGPGTPQDTPNIMKVIDQYKSKLPIFGVCLGMQAIGAYFNLPIIRAKYPMHGKVSTLVYDVSHPLFCDIKSPLEVCRYHSLVVSKSSEETDIDVIAKTIDGEIMAISHKQLPLWGVQFHPEAILTIQGKTLLKNWLTNFNIQ